MSSFLWQEKGGSYRFLSYLRVSSLLWSSIRIARETDEALLTKVVKHSLMWFQNRRFSLERRSRPFTSNLSSYRGRQKQDIDKGVKEVWKVQKHFIWSLANALTWGDIQMEERYEKEAVQFMENHRWGRKLKGTFKLHTDFQSEFKFYFRQTLLPERTCKKICDIRFLLTTNRKTTGGSVERKPMRVISSSFLKDLKQPRSWWSMKPRERKRRKSLLKSTEQTHCR